MHVVRHALALLIACASSFALADNVEEFRDATALAVQKPQGVNGNLEFIGNVSYSASNEEHRITFSFDRLQNSSAVGYSGRFQVKMFLTFAPVVPGEAFTYFSMGAYPYEPLLAGDYRGPDTRTVPMRLPFDGIYYISIGAFEKAVDPDCWPAGYCLDDFVTFPTLVQISDGIITDYGPVNPAPTTAAVEYFHAGFGHYFFTADPAEIAGLDGGAYDFAYQRTGQQWKVWTSGAGVDMCRFFTTPGTFGAKSSHFYTPVASECEGLKLNPAWIFEKNEGRVELPTAGVCPVGTQILYRLYNQGQTGAPNHRYTTSLAIRSQMIAQGFVPEDSNNACVPL
jgi:hypothetical protein